MRWLEHPCADAEFPGRYTLDEARFPGRREPLQHKEDDIHEPQPHHPR